MLVAVVVTLLDRRIVDYTWIVAGLVIGSGLGVLMGRLVKMTDMPQMVGLLNAFGGAASALVVLAAPLGVVAGTPLLSPALVGPLLRCSLVALPLIAVAAVLHLQGPLRGRVERVASWELVLSWLTGWPSALAGAVAGLVAGPSSGNARRDGTTRPRVRDDRRLPIRTIAPLLAG